MQNKKSFLKKIRDKGYYIVLLLCVAAVGVSGYLFCKSLTGEETPSNLGLSVQNTVTETAPSAKAGGVDEPAQAVIGSAEQTEATEETKSSLKTASPADGEILQVYSVEKLAYNVTMRDWRTHSGVDIETADGAQVCAAADGTVSAVFADDYLGQTVVVTHADGYVTHYANLSETVNVAVGDTLAAGDCIGTVGATALAEKGEAPHLHFEVYKNNVSIDPSTFLP